MERIRTYDNVTGVMIIWMIILHLILLLNFSLPMYISRLLAFFMSWFYFKSGMLYKEKDSRLVLNNNLRKLIKPFIVYNLVAYFVLRLVDNVYKFLANGDVITFNEYIVSLKHDVINLCWEGAIFYNAPLWFLPSLFFVKVVFNILKLKNCNIFIVAFISLLSAYTVYRLKLHIPLYVGNILLGLFFYSIGYIYNYYNLRIIKWNWLVIIVFISIFLLYPSNVDFRINMANKGSYLLWCLYSICGCILSVNLFTYRIKLIEYIGKNSMSFYVWHWPIILIVKYYICS